MEKAIENLLKNRRETREKYVKILERDLEKNKSLSKEVEKDVENLRGTRDHVEILSRKVEHAALIPLSKRCYAFGNIVHTGEYYVDKKAHPNSYSVLQTKDQTLAYLDRRIKSESETLDQCQKVEQQLEERLEMLKVGGGPAQIKSDKGVALKVGDVYEIIEFED